MVKEHKIDSLHKLLKNPKPFVEFILETIVASYDLSDPKAKQKALEEGVEFLRTLPVILQEEYRAYLAALLKILPSKIPLKRRKNSSTPKELEIKDTQELSIIKTMLVYPQTIDTIADILSPEHFTFHKEEFQAALQGDETKLRSILLDEDILPIEPQNLKDGLLVFLIKFYERKLQELAKTKMEFKRKTFLIRKYKETILRLKRGELIVE